MKNYLPLVRQYVLALLVTFSVTGFLYFFQLTFNLSIVALIYLLPVGLSTGLWGLGPGIMASLLAFLSLNYFFIQPYYSLMVHQPQDLLALLVFLIVAVVINQLVGRVSRSLELATEREREAIRLYELGKILAGATSDRAIIHGLAEQVVVTFQVDRAEVVLKESESLVTDLVRLDGKTGQLAHLADWQEDRPDLLVPLQTQRGLMGEIRLWRPDLPFTGDEERLLNTFAAQGVLALERTRFSVAENRAQILEESDRLKTALLSSVSHELRTPLATIKASVSSLRSNEVDWDSEPRDELLAVIEEETDHLNLLVGNLLNMSRLEVGALTLQRKWNVLPEIVASVARRMHASGAAPRLRLKSHFIQIDLPDDLPLVPVDYFLMEQVFANLISNSLKYSPEGTVITISALQPRTDKLQVQVRNQGPRVAEEHLERIFDQFIRVTAAERITGTGLGLSICKGIIEAHGGQIWAENLEDGLAFNFTLPLELEGAPPRVNLE